MKTRNSESRVRFEPTYLAFCASVLTNTPPMLPDVTTLPMPTFLCDSLPERSFQTITFIYTFLFKCIN